MNSPAERSTLPCPEATGDRNDRRRWHEREDVLADFLVQAKYTHFQPALGRRETFAEAVARVEAMHRTFLGNSLCRRVSFFLPAAPVDPSDQTLLADKLAGKTLSAILADAFQAVSEKRVLPSMRSLQFGGEQILRNHARLYNCAFSPVDRIEFFREYFFLLLSGTGCGFSVQPHHVSRLPCLPPRPANGRLPVRRFHVVDTLEGWADAVHAVIASHFESHTLELDTSALATEAPLRNALEDVESILDRAAGRRLRPIEIYDACLFLSRSVLSGGIRRSASLCLFSPHDDEMMRAKTGNWLAEQPQRAACTHSAVISRTAHGEAAFRSLFKFQREFGEPGIFFSDHPDFGCNPCGETGLHPVLTEPLEPEEFARLCALGFTPQTPPKTRLSGWQMCNLSTLSGPAAHDRTEFLVACIQATVIGTVQAAYTNIPYLGPVTRYLNERDALLGVSICGFMDQPSVLLSPRTLEQGARICRATNQIIATLLGIRPAARVTCVKPEGTASLILGAAAGIHPRPARCYFRRVQINRENPVYQAFRRRNRRLIEPSATDPETEDVITFPLGAPRDAILQPELTAVEFLERVRMVQRHWVFAGETPNQRSPGLHHNVSHTCTVKRDEWPGVADYLWRHRFDFTGIALLAEDGATRYPQPPVEPVKTPEDADRWNQMRCHPVDYRAIPDSTTSSQPTPADPCAVGACDGY